ncbi:MAG: phospho-N-acetylmuramoyl-pentapeptide-transferase [Lentisphaerae bacterium]|jgi:phospho-N-acetylmuramoyl-pentapeptide-transferase|nr:phospho-N-acetylmuramoyl-pentapeptide-transferase [Lentisphaerota bacterium]
MLYLFGKWFGDSWGPLRLLNSHLMLLSIGTMLGGLLVWSRLPRLWHLLPRDKCKVLAADGGSKAAGKPTGAGLMISLLLLPVILLVVPMDVSILGVVICLYLAMLFGYLDDASAKPWGELKKGLLDALVALAAAFCICKGQPVEIWLPVIKSTLTVGPWLYIPCAAALLWFTMNATNCSDGVDGLAGSLTLISLFSLAALLYGVVGYLPIARYLLVPHYANGARWAILTATVAGGLAGYLWHNAEPSRVLMGDAGSRMLGLLVGVAVLAAGNPFLVIVVAPVALVNGGTGLLKMVLLRLLKRVGFDTTPPNRLTPEAAAHQHLVVRALHHYRFPLHDHCRKNMMWSNAQVLMRFVLVQAFLTPALFVILIKIR